MFVPTFFNEDFGGIVVIGARVAFPGARLTLDSGFGEGSTMHKFVFGSFAVALIPLVAAALWEAVVLLRAISFLPPDQPAPSSSPSGDRPA
jgi:hypothetical protein